MRFMKSIGGSSNKNDYFKEDDLKKLEINNNTLKKEISKSKHRKINSGSGLKHDSNSQSENNLLL